MTAKKRVVKKPAKKAVSGSASASNGKPVGIPSRNRDKDAIIDKTAEAMAMRNGGATGKEPPAKILGKVISVIVSVGSDDRARNIEDFTEAVRDTLKKSKAVNGKGRGAHITPTTNYYVVDGKVCLPQDYDEKRQNFAKGKTPPPWAGGPSETRRVVQGGPVGGTHEERVRSAKQFDAKYGKGGTAPGTITPAMQKDAREKNKLAKQQSEDENLEEIEWSPDDAFDDEGNTKVADESASRAVKKIKRPAKKSAPKKVVKKPAAKKTAAKKTVTRRKK